MRFPRTRIFVVSDWWQRGTLACRYSWIRRVYREEGIQGRVQSQGQLKISGIFFCIAGNFLFEFYFFQLVLRFPPHKGRFDLLFPLRERDGGGGRWGRRSLSRLLKSKMAAVLHRNSMDRDDEYHSQLRLIKRIIKNNTIYYIKVSGIASGNKSIKTTYPHMWRYDILT